MRNAYHKTFTVFIVVLAAVFMAASTNTNAAERLALPSLAEQRTQLEEMGITIIFESEDEVVLAPNTYVKEPGWGRVLGKFQEELSPCTSVQPCTTDLLVVYNDEVLDLFGGSYDALEDATLFWMDYLNQALFRSSAWQYIRLVGLERVALPSADALLSTFLLGQAVNGEPGDWAYIDATRGHRAERSADLVLFARDGGKSVAYRPVGPAPSFGWGHVNVSSGGFNNAFQLGNASTVAHEIGHMIGGAHGDSAAPDRSIDEHPNARAFVSCGTKENSGIKTQMHSSYRADCPEFAPVSAQIPAFSSNGLRWDGPAGEITGNPRHAEGPFGDAEHDNVATFNHIGRAISLYSETLEPSGGGVATPVSTECQTGPEHQCVVNDMFRLSGTYHLLDGTVGEAHVIEVADSDRQGTVLLWFFRDTNYELMVKVLSGCAVNGHYWVFAGGLTNVENFLRVEYKGGVRTYHNPPRTAYQPVQDTTAFPCN